MSHSVMVSTTDFDSVSPSSNLGGTTTNASVAQLVLERQTVNLRVIGSNPI